MYLKIKFILINTNKIRVYNFLMKIKRFNIKLINKITISLLKLQIKLENLIKNSHSVNQKK